MTHFISINGHAIRTNIGRIERGEELEPPIRIASKKSGSAVEYASGVAILDDDGNEVAWLEYRPEAPLLKCGARLMLRTKNDAVVTAR